MNDTTDGLKMELHKYQKTLVHSHWNQQARDQRTDWSFGRKPGSLHVNGACESRKKKPVSGFHISQTSWFTCNEWVFIQSNYERLKTGLHSDDLSAFPFYFEKPAQRCNDHRVQQKVTRRGLTWLDQKFTQTSAESQLEASSSLRSLTNLQFYVGNLNITSSPLTFSNLTAKRKKSKTKTLKTINVKISSAYF